MHFDNSPSSSWPGPKPGNAVRGFSQRIGEGVGIPNLVDSVICHAMPNQTLSAHTDLMFGGYGIYMMASCLILAFTRFTIQDITVQAASKLRKIFLCCHLLQHAASMSMDDESPEDELWDLFTCHRDDTWIY